MRQEIRSRPLSAGLLLLGGLLIRTVVQSRTRWSDQIGPGILRPRTSSIFVIHSYTGFFRYCSSPAPVTLDVSESLNPG